MIYVDTSLMELAKWNRALNKKNMLRPMFLTIFGEMRMKIENGDTSLVLNIVGGFYFNLDINEKLSHIKTMMLTFENAVLIRDYLDKYLKEWHKTTEINKQTNSESEKMREKFTIAKLLIALKNRNECQMLSLNSSEQADLIPEVEKLLSELEKLQQENFGLTQNVHNKVNSVISGEQNKTLEQIHIRLIQKYNSNQNLSLDRKEIGEIADQIKRLFKENELLLMQNDVLKNENNTLNQECTRRIVENERLCKENGKLSASVKYKDGRINECLEAYHEADRLKTHAENCLAVSNAHIKSFQEEIERSKERIEDIKHTLELIPKCIYTNQHGNTHVDLKALESFVKNALAKELEREKWYVVKCTDFDKPMPAYINSDGQWICDGSFCLSEYITVLNTTPIDLGEPK